MALQQSVVFAAADQENVAVIKCNIKQLPPPLLQCFSSDTKKKLDIWVHEDRWEIAELLSNWQGFY